MDLLRGVHHITFVTADMDRLIDFYARIFGAEVTLDETEDGMRHTFLEVGPETVLHPFEIPGVEPPDPMPMFERGRLDHFALRAATFDAFRELHRRLDDEGAVEGDVIDMGSLLLLNAVDPDGMPLEVVWVKPGVPVEKGIRREAWTTVDMTD